MLQRTCPKLLNKSTKQEFSLQIIENSQLKSIGISINKCYKDHFEIGLIVDIFPKWSFKIKIILAENMYPEYKQLKILKNPFYEKKF